MSIYFGIFLSLFYCLYYLYCLSTLLSSETPQAFCGSFGCLRSECAPAALTPPLCNGLQFKTTPSSVLKSHLKTLSLTSLLIAFRYLQYVLQRCHFDTGLNHTIFYHLLLLVIQYLVLFYSFIILSFYNSAPLMPLESASEIMDIVIIIITLYEDNYTVI